LKSIPSQNKHSKEKETQTKIVQQLKRNTTKKPKIKIIMNK